MALSFVQSNKSNKRIALGGRSKGTETRAELLKRAQEDRERRARERLERQSALTIQAAWRAHRVLEEARREERNYFAHEYGESTRRLAISSLEKAARSLVFFCNPRLQSDLDNLCEVLQSVQKSSQGVAARAPNASPEDTTLNIFCLAKLVCTATSVLAQYEYLSQKACYTPARKVIEPTEDALLQTVARFLQSSAGRHEWNHVRQAETGNGKLLDLCVKFGALDKLTGILVRENDTIAKISWDEMQALSIADQASQSNLTIYEGSTVFNGGTVMEVICNWFCECLARSEPQSIRGKGRASIVQEEGCVHRGVPLQLASTHSIGLLCAAHLWQSYPVIKPRALLLLQHFARSVKDTEHSSFINQLAKDQQLGLLCNLLGAISICAQEADRVDGLEKLPDSDFVTILKITKALLQHILNQDFVDSVYPADAQDAGTMEFQWAPPVDLLIKQCQLVFSGIVIRHMASAALSPHNPTGQQGVMQSSVGPKLWSFCQLLLAAEQAPNGILSSQVEIALATSPSLIPQLWYAYFKPCMVSGRWYSPPGIASADLGYLVPLTILSKCFTGVLSTISETEFYAAQQPLPFKELYNDDKLGLLDLLRTSLFQALWSESRALNTDVKEARLACAAASGRLMGQLHNRNCRRPFVDPQAFASEMLKSQMFLAEVRSSLARGGFLEASGARVWKILEHAPFLVDFEVRAQVLNEVITADKWVNGREGLHIRVRRKHVFWDGLAALEKAKSMKGRLRIVFEDEYGMQEAGIDGGGLFKDFMENLIKQAFDPQLGLFIPTSDNRLYPNPNANLAVDSCAEAFQFLGKMVGKALYEGIILELPLALFFLKQLLQRGAELNDLATLDAELYKNLMFLSSYEGDVEDLALTFTISQDAYDAQREVELVPNGREKAVTSANRSEYILRTANFRLNVETRRYTDDFRYGMECLIDPMWLSMFNEEELQMLIAGKMTSGLDIQDLKSNVQFGNGYDADHPTISLLWEVLEDFTPKQQNQWLKFVTSCSRPPLLGFQHLQPHLMISMSHSEDRLPSSSTCSNLLKLPPIKSKENLASKLLYAIENVQGFDLS